MAARKTVEDEYTPLDQLSDNVLTCKMLWAHAWAKNPTPKHIDGMLAKMASYIVCLRCTRCRRERYDYRDSLGRRIGKPYYKDPVGYPKTHRVNSDELWYEAVQRSLLISTYDPNTNGVTGG